MAEDSSLEKFNTPEAKADYVMAALRIAGIFLAPLGGVLGWL